MPTVFISPTSGYTTDNTDGSGSTSGDFASTTGSIGSTFSSDLSPTRPDDLYNIQNKFPTTYPTTINNHNNINNNNNNNIPQVVDQKPEIHSNPIDNSNNHNPNHNNNNIGQRPINTKHPQIHRPQHPYTSYVPDSPDVHHSYPLGPDPFPDYFPQSHPHYHFHIDQFDKDSHFPGVYAPHHNAPSLHHNTYPIVDQYGLYPASRYPVDDGAYAAFNPNRKNGYQVNENVHDKPMARGS
jgi:hypothetical protein